jgi:hypothetical protein
MVHRISGQIGVVENVVEAQSGWPPQVTVKLKDGAVRKGKLSDFRDASGVEKKKYSAPPESLGTEKSLFLFYFPAAFFLPVGGAPSQ